MVRVGGFIRISLAYLGVLAGALAVTSAHAEVGARNLGRGTEIEHRPETSFSSPARFFSIKEVLAKVDAAKAAGIFDRPDWQLRLASLSEPDTRTLAPEPASPQSDEPFGLLTFRAPEGTLWRKWRGLEAGLAAEDSLIDRCQTDVSACTPAALRFVKIVEMVKAKEGRSRIAEANRDINAVVNYVTDYAQFGEPDRWTTPLETLTSSRGDCEDYAIAKYAVLRRAGFVEEDLRLVLVNDRAARQDHAVLAVRHDGKWLVLDNRHNVINEDIEQQQFTPLFALDQGGVKLFAAPYNGRPQIEKVKMPAPTPAAALDTGDWEMRGTLAAGEPASTGGSGRPLLL